MFLRAMNKQIQSAGKRGFFSKRSAGSQVREKFTFEDMLCFQKVMICCFEGTNRAVWRFTDVWLQPFAGSYSDLTAENKW